MTIAYIKRCPVFLRRYTTVFVANGWLTRTRYQVTMAKWKWFSRTIKTGVLFVFQVFPFLTVCGNLPPWMPLAIAYNWGGNQIQSVYDVVVAELKQIEGHGDCTVIRVVGNATVCIRHLQPSYILQ